MAVFVRFRTIGGAQIKVNPAWVSSLEEFHNEQCNSQTMIHMGKQGHTHFVDEPFDVVVQRLEEVGE